MGENKVTNTILNTLLLGPNTTEVTIRNLSSFTTYKVIVVPVTSGDQRSSSVQIEASKLKNAPIKLLSVEICVFTRNP